MITPSWPLRHQDVVARQRADAAQDRQDLRVRLQLLGDAADDPATGSTEPLTDSVERLHAVEEDVGRAASMPGSPSSSSPGMGLP